MASSAISNVGGSAGPPGATGATGPTGPAGPATSADTIWDAKGDIAAATGPDAAVRVPVGTDGQVLTADAASAAGVKWAAGGGGGGGGGGGAAVVQVGYDAIGASWEAMTATRTYCKQIVLTQAGTLLGIAAYVRNNVDNIEALGAMVMADNAGAPGLLLAANGAPYSNTSLATGTFYLSSAGAVPGTGRWFHIPIGVTLPAGTYWIAVIGDTARLDIAYDASGTDQYFTPGQYILSGAYPSAWAITTGTRKYSLRASVVMSGGPVPVYDNVLASDLPGWDVAGISGAYAHLMVVLNSRGTTAAAQVVTRMRFNGDAGNNYDWQQLYAVGGTVGANGAGGVSFARLGFGVGASAAAGKSSSASALIQNYAGTTFQKTFTGSGMLPDPTSGFFTLTFSGQWASTAAINRVQVFPETDNFKAGSRLTIYGMP